jgi:hypothetical protein
MPGRGSGRGVDEGAGAAVGDTASRTLEPHVQDEEATTRRQLILAQVSKFAIKQWESWFGSQYEF